MPLGAVIARAGSGGARAATRQVLHAEQVRPALTVRGSNDGPDRQRRAPGPGMTGTQAS